MLKNRTNKMKERLDSVKAENLEIGNFSIVETSTEDGARIALDCIPFYAQSAYNPLYRFSPHAVRFNF